MRLAIDNIEHWLRMSCRTTHIFVLVRV